MNTNSSPTTELAVAAHGLVKTFGDLRAVDGIDLEVRRGEVFGVLGPNGAGKTTMLQMLATLLPMDGGSAEIFGVDVAEVPARGAPAGRRHRAVRLGRREPHRPREPLAVRPAPRRRQEEVARDRRASCSAGSASRTPADKQISQFSGGMRRRLDLAASLITRPPLIFLDEPTTGLDPRTRGQMWDTIRDLVAQGCTVLLTTQYLDEADQLADRIAVIDHGVKVAEGTLRPAQGPGRLLDPAAAAARPGTDRPGASTSYAAWSATSRCSPPRRAASTSRCRTPTGPPTC